MPQNEKIITNCHIHLFTMRDVPQKIIPFLPLLTQFDFTKKTLIWFLRRINPFSKRDIFERYANFLETIEKDSQKETFKSIQQKYPKDTRFIVLPMDLRALGKGEPIASIREQHEKLYELKKQYPNTLLPFIHIDPRSKIWGGEDPIEFITEFHQKGFWGIKLYPPLGYYPNHPEVKKIFAYANTHHLPVTVHCSRGGVRGKNFSNQEVAKATAPHNYIEILDQYPNLKLSLAHFGGLEDWGNFLDDRDPHRQKNQADENWVSQILDMLNMQDADGNPKYPNLYTDVSYTVFKLRRFVPILKVLLTNENVRNRTLFGSDYYMNSPERLTERELSMYLRAELGEELFWQIAQHNPKQFLGEI